MRLSMKSNRLTGFSLIELMIAIAIIGIIAAVALPSYQNYVRQSNRAVAKTILHENAQFMEQFYTENNRYDQNLAGNAVALPITQSPRTGAVQYNVTLQAVGNATFTLQAVPAGTMAGDVCGTLTLTNTGLQGAGGNVADCWNR
ncbi:type IV pilus assembly protein PilE [Nitrosomonas aestuarii]|uniref:Type IV pilus assembly protein PilE n=2 Tax=Nitrosomonas aestuarii TaxID=52441 RepID=A0A1I4F7I5_9PROT|nr:type IV pilus assembly protein PilE [Nitrosomonas aestuarii]SFL13864.1 type IV pilus assembly protein PilE [Nitrosomonas aestuarii]